LTHARSRCLNATAPTGPALASAARQSSSGAADALRTVEQSFAPERLRVLLGSAHSAPVAAQLEAALGQPLRDFLSRPGKALRGRIVTHCYAIAGGVGACPVELPAILELLHAGSLIVDDIQDESVTRRGGPALHQSAGLPVALNAANWLYFFALSLLETAPLALPAAVELRLHRSLHSALLRGHFGQALDLNGRVERLRQDHVPAVVAAATRLKTGSLMELAATLGAGAAGASESALPIFSEFGQAVGTALQMLDDVGSLRAPARQHKALEDARLGRPTWAWAWLAQSLGAREYGALAELSRKVGANSEPAERLLEALRAHKLSTRTAAEALRTAGTRLSTLLGPSAALTSLFEDLQLLERSYG
jgi:geranylgeranyl pyrophosphate synthase